MDECRALMYAFLVFLFQVLDLYHHALEDEVDPGGHGKCSEGGP